MCGRYTLKITPTELKQFFQVIDPPELTARYNIAPTQSVLVIRLGDDGREATPMRWGLIPSWAKDPSIASRMINARIETVAEKPSFRTAFKRRRCIVPASGWYEWKKDDDGSKPPYLIQHTNNEPLGFAGLWEHWRPSEEETIETFTILTRDATPELEHVHDRMPVILDPAAFGHWLDPAVQDAVGAFAILQSGMTADGLEAYPVSTRVNSVRNDDPACLERQ